jgi:hypothetical protein
MPKIPLSYRVVELAPARWGSHNFLDLYWSNHNIYALLEVDVTNVRRSSRSMKRGRARHCRLLAAWPFASRVR